MRKCSAAARIAARLDLNDHYELVNGYSDMVLLFLRNLNYNVLSGKSSFRRTVFVQILSLYIFSKILHYTQLLWTSVDVSRLFFLLVLSLYSSHRKNWFANRSSLRVLASN